MKNLKPLTIPERKVLEHALRILVNMDSEFIKKSEKKIGEKFLNMLPENNIAWIVKKEG